VDKQVLTLNRKEIGVAVDNKPNNMTMTMTMILLASLLLLSFFAMLSYCACPSINAI